MERTFQNFHLITHLLDGHETQTIHSVDRVHRRIMHFLWNELIIMLMSLFNASICTMNSHTYIELLLLLLSYLFDSCIHPFGYSHFMTGLNSFEMNRFVFQTVRFSVRNRWQCSDHFGCHIITLHFLMYLVSHSRQIVYCQRHYLKKHTVFNWIVRSFNLEIE